MSINTIWRLDAVDLNVDTGTPGARVTQLSNQQWNQNVQSLVERGSAHVHPLFTATQSQEPAVTFTTTQLATLLGYVGIEGRAITHATNTYFKKAAKTGSVARATTEHTRCTLNSGMIHWTTITLNHIGSNGQGSSTVECVLSAEYDGTNNPFVVTGDVALAGNITNNEIFGAGPAYINDTQLRSIKSVTIESGIVLLVEGADSDVWPTFIGLQTTDPVVTITSTEVSPFVSVDSEGEALDGSEGLVVFGRKLSKNNTGGVSRVANGTGEHLSFTGLNGRYWVNDLSGDGNTPINTVVTATLAAADDDTLPLVIATNATIP